MVQHVDCFQVPGVVHEDVEDSMMSVAKSGVTILPEGEEYSAVLVARADGSLRTVVETSEACM